MRTRTLDFFCVKWLEVGAFLNTVANIIPTEQRAFVSFWLRLLGRLRACAFIGSECRGGDRNPSTQARCTPLIKAQKHDGTFVSSDQLKIWFTGYCTSFCLNFRLRPWIAQFRAREMHPQIYLLELRVIYANVIL